MPKRKEEDTMVQSVEEAAAAAAAAKSPAKKRAKNANTEDASKSPPKKRVAVDLGPTVGLNPTDPANFDHFLFQLLAYKAARDNYHVNKDEQPELHAWLMHVKREYKKHMQAKYPEEATEDTPSTPCELTATQIQVLEMLHVPLTNRGGDHWNRFYDLLKQYGERHGHILVPRLCEVPGLGDWVTDQRRQYKAWSQGQSTQLSQERREKLEAIGFTWSVRNRPEWDSRFNELLEYKKKFGDCKVPQHYKDNKALGKWVAKQREQYKLYKRGEHSFLTADRLEKLQGIGFVWSVRTSGDADVESVASPPATAAAEKHEQEPATAAI
jgi:hypothetical protein